ncbi:MAG: dephospho-CoA kinase [Bacteroidetes bacterium]|nr:dephospho-CoA kinase [Bacteroidota bacterium]
MALVIGITGGIGSGKSTVCQVFKLLGIPVFEADAVAKKLIHSNSVIKTGLIDLFGEDIFAPNEQLNRKKLANIIFNDAIQLKKVNELVHPVVREEFKNWLKLQESAYVIHEAAILFESGFYKMMDFTIFVSAPENQRIEWVMQRDGASENKVKERMEKQWTDKQKRKLASVEIKNNSRDLIIPQIIKIDNQLKEYGKIW